MKTNDLLKLIESKESFKGYISTIKKKLQPEELKKLLVQKIILPQKDLHAKSEIELLELSESVIIIMDKVNAIIESFYSEYDYYGSNIFESITGQPYEIEEFPSKNVHPENIKKIIDSYREADQKQVEEIRLNKEKYLREISENLQILQTWNSDLLEYLKAIERAKLESSIGGNSSNEESSGQSKESTIE